jgi:hypothetical protein
MKGMTLFLLAATGFAGAASAQTPSQPDPKQDPSKVVCKKQPKTGTRMVDRICHTRAEWDQITEQNRRDAAEMVNRALPVGCTRPNEC